MKVKKKVNQRKNIIDYNLDRDYSKYYWLIIPLLTIIYFTYSFFSTGFYQDDEVAHFINMKDFSSNPWIIMSNWGKPGWKILLVGPSLLGYKTVLIFNSFITALTAYFSVLLAKELKLKNTLLAGIFFAFQPLILQLSFRSYAEIFTGMLLVLTLLFYFKEKYILSGLLCGLAFTVRQESALICLILAVYMIINKKYIPVLSIGFFPLLLNMLGYIQTGDILWAVSEMKALGELDMGIKRSFFHYFEVYIYIIGPVIFTLFVIGLITPFFLKEKKKEFVQKYLLVYLFFFTIFLFQCYLVIKGTNPGSWRYVLQVSPFASLIALIGFNELIDIKKKKFILPSMVGILFLTLIFLSKEATGLVITDTSEYSKFIVMLLLFAGIVFFILWQEEIRFIQFVIVVTLLTAGFTFYSEKPKQQSPENLAVKQIADWYNQNADKSKEVLYNHQLIIFFGDISKQQRSKFKILNKKILDESPEGTIVVWDSHYSYRPEYKNDTELDYLNKNSMYKPLNQFLSSDKRFAAYIYQKL